MAGFSSTRAQSILSMSTLPVIAKRVKHMTMGLGVFLLIFSVSMPLLIGVYSLSILLAVVFFLMGIFGVVAGSRIKARSTPTNLVAQSVLIEVNANPATR
jgi:hypothetical protein